MRSLFQVPQQGQKDFFRLPAGVEQSLRDLYARGEITYQEAMTHSTRPDELARAAARLPSGAAGGWAGLATGLILALDPLEVHLSHYAVNDATASPAYSMICPMALPSLMYG